MFFKGRIASPPYTNADRMHFNHQLLEFSLSLFKYSTCCQWDAHTANLCHGAFLCPREASCSPPLLRAGLQFKKPQSSFEQLEITATQPFFPCFLVLREEAVAGIHKNTCLLSRDSFWLPMVSQREGKAMFTPFIPPPAVTKNLVFLD